MGNSRGVFARYPDPPQEFSRGWASSLVRALEERDRQPSESLYRVVNVKDYGAVGDGVKDDTSAVVNAINNMPDDGGVLSFGPGKFLLSDIDINKSGLYYGCGRATTIRAASASENVLNVTHQGVTLRDLTFDSSVTRTGGAYVSIVAPDVKLSDFMMDGAFVGVDIPSTTAIVTIESGYIRNCVPSTGVGIQIAGGYDVSIRDIVMDHTPNTAACIVITGCGDVTIEDCNLIHGDVSLKLAPTAGKVCASVWANNTFFDTSGTHALLVSPTGAGAHVVRSVFDQCWFSSSGNHGAMLTSDGSGDVDGVDFNGCQFFLNGGDGVRINHPSAKNVFVNSGVAAGNAGGGVSVAQNCDSFGILGLRSGNSHGLSGNGHGVFIGTGCTGYRVIGCDLRGNTTGNLSDGSGVVTGVGLNLV